jgi:hypothetical protein
MPKLSIGIDPTSDFSLSFDWQELKKNSEEVLNLPETIANKKGIKFIICLDEFQNLSSFKDYLVFEKKLRASWQRHKSVTYCLFGSKRHMMTEIFNNPSKPFYRFGDIMLLQKIETKKWVTFIRKSFEKTDKHSRNHPYRNEKSLMVCATVSSLHVECDPQPGYRYRDFDRIERINQCKYAFVSKGN